jgi:hypothetical protein
VMLRARIPKRQLAPTAPATSRPASKASPCLGAP